MLLDHRALIIVAEINLFNFQFFRIIDFEPVTDSLVELFQIFIGSPTQKEEV